MVYMSMVYVCVFNDKSRQTNNFLSSVKSYRRRKEIKIIYFMCIYLRPIFFFASHTILNKAYNERLLKSKAGLHYI